jgi:glycosyltransferase involved in cell wall biosynthesis
MKKLLTVAVPCYNVDWCLDKCLSSFITEPLLNELEIIIVNDGSTDNTLEVASNYVATYPDIFSLIDKKNGGHGSGINAAIKQANGKYFKVVDADDWVLTENLHAFLEILAATEADAIITHYRMIDMITGHKKEHKTRNIQMGKIYTLDEFTATPGGIFNCTVFHGLSYRTEVYRNSGTILSEGIFYEDHEYATLPFLSVQTVLPIDMFLYDYLVGNTNQSISDKNQLKRLGHIEHVVKKLFRFYHDNRELLSKGNLRYIARKATDVLVSYYLIAMVKNPDKRGGKLETERIRRELDEIDPVLVSHVDIKYRIALLMNRLRVTGQIFKLMTSVMPDSMFRKLFKRNQA